MAVGAGQIKEKLFDREVLNPVLYLGVFTALVAVGLFGYLGTFSRYGGDDYCLSAFYFQDVDFISRMVQRYLGASSRYTNILFIGLADSLFGWYNVAVLPPLMLGLFVWGAYLFLEEVVRLASLGWNRLIILFLAALAVYLSVLQAPNLYETLYWRAGMTSHFAPLVFLTFLGAFLLKEIRLAGERKPSIWSFGLGFFGALVIGGFSEPPVAVLIVILGLSILAVWLWGNPALRHARLSILVGTLAGALLSLALLALAPANSIRLETPPPGLVELLIKSFQYPMEFIVDVFRSRPTPALVNFLLPLVLFYAYYSRQTRSFSGVSGKQTALLLFAAAVLTYLLIAASFAPSVYGQSFPVPRARFAGQVILTCGLMVSGALIGLLIAKSTVSPTVSTILRPLAVIVLLLLTLFPLRTASRLAAEVPVYQQRAQAWDGRDADIRALQAEGARDLTVPFLSSEIIQDLGDRSGFRLNRCASILYGVDSIVARPVKK
ncbi:MAG TPA: hypothetical protein VFY26_02780 [Anaerolineales bacterium]|nr:hypothetical protein [Anaerolineales bacterium]